MRSKRGVKKARYAGGMKNNDTCLFKGADMPTAMV